MKTHLVSVALYLMATLSFAQSPGQEQQTVLDLSKKKFDWLITRRIDSLGVLLDDEVQYIHSNGWIQSRNDVLEDIRSGKLNYNKVTIKETGVRLYNTTAIVTGLGTFEGINDGKPFSLELRYTEVYVKTKNHWKLVLRHANRMP